jgi:two-component system response regulator PilR (NtrC family)
VRVLSATHKDLHAEVQAGRFRQDLFYRLNVIQITLPALRERLDDLPQLCQRILARLAHEAGLSEVPQLSSSAQAALLQHPFAGNVRELENLLQRAVALSYQPLLQAQDLGLSAAAVSSGFDLLVPATAPSTEPSSARSPLAVAPELTPTKPQALAPLPGDLAAHLDQVERDILVQALEKYRLNRTAAGASMGLSLRQMRYRLARLGVQVSDQGIVLGERFDPDADTDPA